MAKVDDFRCEIELELGAPVIDVELDEKSWTAIVQRTKRWFKAKKGVIDCVSVPVVPGKIQYDFPDNACAIIDILLPRRSDIQSLLSLGFPDIVPFNALDTLASTSKFNSYSSYVQVLQSLETRSRIFSAESDWQVLCGKINIMGGCSSKDSSGMMLVVYKKEEWSVDELKDRDEQLFYDYMRASAMHLLGRIRSKYKSYPSAGGSIDTDGPELIDEAKEEYLRLEEEISESQGPMGVVLG